MSDRNYFNGKDKYFETLLRQFKSKPDLNYLEIGTCEGSSLLWMMESILNHPSSRAVSIDSFYDETKNILLKNLTDRNLLDKVTLLEGYSQKLLRTLPTDHFDLIYIDGSHRAQDVLSDAIQSWELLKIGGMLIFDDYTFINPTQPEHAKPQYAIDAFLHCFQADLKILRKSTDVFVTKTRSTYF